MCGPIITGPATRKAGRRGAIRQAGRELPYVWITHRSRSRVIYDISRDGVQQHEAGHRNEMAHAVAHFII